MGFKLFELDNYLFRRRFFSFGGRTFDFMSPDKKSNHAYCRMKLFRLKEEITIYTDSSMSTKMLFIKAQNVIDFSAKYDVYDSEHDDRIIGTWKRQGLNSLIQDSWILTLPGGRELQLTEDSTALALVRRILSSLIPQTYYLRDGNKDVAVFRQKFNPFLYRLDVQILDGDEEMRKLIAAGAQLLAAIEGRQN